MDYDEIENKEYEEILKWCEEIYKKDLTTHYNVEVVNYYLATDS